MPPPRVQKCQLPDLHNLQAQWRPPSLAIDNGNHINPVSSTSRNCLPHLAHPAGAMAGAVVSACVQPLDVLRTRMQADAAAGRLQGSVFTLRMLLREAGTR